MAQPQRDRWVADPSCFEDPVLYRSTSMAAPAARSDRAAGAPYVPDMSKPCVLVLPLPKRYPRLRTAQGHVVFDDGDWWSVVGSAFLFAKNLDPALPRFGIKYPRDPKYYWWDETSSEEDRLAGPDAVDFIRPWIERIYPDATGPIELIDQRAAVDD